MSSGSQEQTTCPMIPFVWNIQSENVYKGMEAGNVQDVGEGHVAAFTHEA